MSAPAVAKQAAQAPGMARGPFEPHGLLQNVAQPPAQSMLYYQPGVVTLNSTAGAQMFTSANLGVGG